MSLTTKTLEHVVPAYNLPRGEVAAAAQETAETEAPHAAQAAQAAVGSELAHNPVLLNLSSGACSALPRAFAIVDWVERQVSGRAC